MKKILQKEYDLYLGKASLEKLAEILRDKAYSAVFVLMDENTHKHCWSVLEPILQNAVGIIVAAGESNKTLQSAEKIWEQLQTKQADRNSVLINLGGGMICDLGGFCAATYKRGIDFINVPTSLLAMVDAGIGGKTGVDLNAYKNMVGVFQHPKNIFIYPGFLKTLPEVEFRNGMAEVSKHALIKEKKLFHKLSEFTISEIENEESLIFKSLKIKVETVKKDPFEKGPRKALNFGHTIGHAIESYSLVHDMQPIKHGEAVAFGIICESYLSAKLLGLEPKELHKITTFFLNLFPKYQGELNVNEILHFMKNDKKNEAGKINFTLIKRIGKYKTDINCDSELIIESLRFYQNFNK